VGRCRPSYIDRGHEAARPGQGAHPAGDPIPIIGNRNSKTYHLPSCPDYAKVVKQNRVAFATAEAEKAGFRAKNWP